MLALLVDVIEVNQILPLDFLERGICQSHHEFKNLHTGDVCPLPFLPFFPYEIPEYLYPLLYLGNFLFFFVGQILLPKSNLLLRKSVSFFGNDVKLYSVGDLLEKIVGLGPLAITDIMFAGEILKTLFILLLS